MGKKLYKVYRAGGQQMNPTAMWFAQMGAEQPSQEEMAMMQQQQQQQANPEAEMQQMAQQVMQATAEMMQQGMPVEQVARNFVDSNVPPQLIELALVEVAGIPEGKASGIVSTAVQQATTEGQTDEMSDEELVAMQQEEEAAPAPPMARAGYIKKRLKEAQAGMEQQSDFASDTNLNANKNLEKNTLLDFTQKNVMANQFGNEYDQKYGTGLEQARYGRGKARRKARRLARRAVKEQPGVYDRQDRKALAEGLYSGEFDKYDVIRGVDVFNPEARSKPGYPTVDAGSWNQTMIPGKDWGTGRTIDQMREDAREAGAYEDVTPVTEETSNVVSDFDQAYDYKQENGDIYTRKKGSSDWTKVDPESSAGQAIRKKVFGEDIAYEEADYIDADATGETIEPYEVEEVETTVGDFDPYNKETDGLYHEWLRNLPYNEEGYATDSEGYTYSIDDYNRNYNRSGMNNAPGFDPFSEEAKQRAKEFAAMGYQGYSGEMEYGGQFSDDGLEMARFGRGRARRQARRAARQARRGMGQMDRAMRSVYGNIAFPSGVSPMMLAGMPMMGPTGAGSGMMQFYGRRGPLGGLREFSMNMPMHFSRGMFMNGMFNPYGMGPYGNTAYKISYPGSSEAYDEKTEKDAADKQDENKKIDDNTPGGGDDKGSGNDNNTSEGNEEEIVTVDCATDADCGEGMECWNGECLEECDEGYTRDESGACMKDGEEGSGEDSALNNCNTPIGLELSKMSKEEADAWCLTNKGDGFSYNADTCSCANVGGGFLKDYGPALAVAGTILAFKYRGKLYSIPKNAPAAIKSRFNKIRNYFKKGQTGKVDAEIKKGGLKVEPYTGPKKAPDGPIKVKAKGASGSNQLKVMQGAPAAKTPGATPAAKPAPAPAAKPQGPVRSGSARGVPRQPINPRIQSGIRARVRGPRARVRFDDGGFINSEDQFYGNPDLYRFTGGGPRFTDYFGDGGYYEDGGYYGDGGYYEDVYDPYMPYAENGIIAGQYPMTESEYYKSQQFYDDMDNEILKREGIFHPVLASEAPLAVDPEDIITNKIRQSVINSGRLIDGVTGEEVERSTVRQQYGGYQEGDVVDMTEAQLGAFLMAGGQVEFVD